MRDLENMKVSFLAGTLGQGGAEQQLYYMLAALRRAGASPNVVCLTRGEHWEQPIRDLGVPVTWVGERPSRIARLRLIVAALREQSPDIVQSQHFYTNLYAVGAARALGLREICAIRNNCVGEVRNNGAILGRLSIRAPRLIAANSRAAIRNAIEYGVRAERLRLLPNVVDTDRFQPNGEREPGALRLVAAGRFTTVKRFDRFVRILARVRAESGADVVGTLVGDGPERPRLEALAREIGLYPGAIEFTGVVDSVAAFYRHGDVVVLTSDREGTPNVLLEAMASGLPVVTSRVGDAPDIVGDGETGFLAEPDDEDSMVAALVALAREPQRAREMGRRARAQIEASFGLGRLPSYLSDVYEAALA